MRLPPSDLSIGDRLTRDEIEQLFDTGLDFRASGINPRRDTDGRQYVLLFAGAEGPYDRSVTTGRFEYVGRRSALDDDQPAGQYSLMEATDADTRIPVFFFYRGPDQHRWAYHGRVRVVSYRLDEVNGRQTPVFVLEHEQDTPEFGDKWIETLRMSLERYREQRRHRKVTPRTLRRFGGTTLANACPDALDLESALERGLETLSESDALQRVAADPATYRIGTHGEIQAHRRRLETRLETDPQLTEPQEYTDYERRTRTHAFTELVREAYDETCAVCGSGRETPDGQPEVEAAHIYPKRKNGVDDVRNGLALCKVHHWAFDNGWLAVTDDYRLRVREAPDRAGYHEFFRFADERLHLPERATRHPHPKFLREHRKLHGFEAGETGGERG